MNFRSFLLIGLLFIVSCSSNTEKKETVSQKPARKVDVPAFNADSAFSFVKKQVDFGPRIPNTKAHAETAAFLVKTLQRCGAQVTVQDFEAETYDGQKINLKNIVASFNPEKTKRILLAAHWDTRPFADKDPQKPTSTFQGANDGASGVGVLLEVARAMHAQALPEAGIDIIFFDGEDWGPLNGDLKEWWCLGSQYWSKHKSNYAAYYGILLDMVGAPNAQFHREGYSMEYAPSIVEKVWNHAHRLGYSGVFVNKTQDGITDDHVFVNTIAKIPMIDIVHFEPGIGYFGDFHHTQRDNLDVISKEMLRMVGSTVLNVVYYEVDSD
jgi:Zn-dependent M28 family amino/carboxypeptidase